MKTKPASIPNLKTLKKPAKRAFWLKHVKAFDVGELSMERYCHKHGLVYQQFWYWRNKLGNSPKKANKPSCLVPIKLATPSPQGSPHFIEF